MIGVRLYFEVVFFGADFMGINTICGILYVLIEKLSFLGVIGVH